MTTLAEEFQTTFGAVHSSRAQIKPEIVVQAEPAARAMFYGGVAAAFRLLEERYQAKNPDDLDAEEAVQALLVAMAEVSAEVVSDMETRAAMVMQRAQDQLDQLRQRNESSRGG